MSNLIVKIGNAFAKYAGIILSTIYMTCGMVYTSNPERFSDIPHVIMWGVIEIVMGLIGIIVSIWVIENFKD